MFYPIEDEIKLATLRSLLSPFMVTIQKCFTTESLLRAQIERIVNDVINSISPVIDPVLLNGLNQIITKPENRTLGLEQSALRQISLRYFWSQEKN